MSLDVSNVLLKPYKTIVWHSRKISVSEKSLKHGTRYTRIGLPIVRFTNTQPRFSSGTVITPSNNDANVEIGR